MGTIGVVGMKIVSKFGRGIKGDGADEMKIEVYSAF
jgi:hypothetical protein